MSVTSLTKDYDTLTLIADFSAPIERVWQLWADPRQLERWWGPPAFPASVEQHDFTVGGCVTYVMTGPDGDAYRGWWRIHTVEPPRFLEFVDGFANSDGTPNADMPLTRSRVRLTEQVDGTRMALESTFDSHADMEQLVTMGMAEGLQQAVGQMDALLEPAE